MQLPSIFLLIPTLFLSFLGCNGGNVVLDNAGEKALIVTVDELTYTIDAGAYEALDLEKGRHTISIKSAEGDSILQSTFSIEEGGFVNLAQSTYYIWTDLYGNTRNKAQHLNEDWLKIGEEEIFGEFTPLPKDQLYTEKAWDFGLLEDFPETRIGMELTDDKYILESKIFRESDLVDAYYEVTKEAEEES